jgi:hypothetical protein
MFIVYPIRPNCRVNSSSCISMMIHIGSHFSTITSLIHRTASGPYPYGTLLCRDNPDIEQDTQTLAGRKGHVEIEEDGTRISICEWCRNAPSKKKKQFNRATEMS